MVTGSQASWSQCFSSQKLERGQEAMGYKVSSLPTAPSCSETPPHEGSTPFQNSATHWGANAETREPTEDISHSKNNVQTLCPVE